MINTRVGNYLGVRSYLLLLLAFQPVLAQDVTIPESISLGLLKAIFQPVDFPHRNHAHMSKMGQGCGTCHHDAADESYDPCADCHTNDPSDLDSGVPSLNAAFHRKCLSCHREWGTGNVCGTCHLKAEDTVSVPIGNRLREQPIKYPELVIFQSPQIEQTKVTFHHAEHVELFRIDCANCHLDQSCKTCHGHQEIPVNMEGDLLLRHVPCNNCHDTKLDSGCKKCHLSQPGRGFSHSMTSFPLKSFHAAMECTNCHEATTMVKKLDMTCTNCHGNFELGSFDHAATGLRLEYGHEDLDCYECHLEEKFDVPPSCIECHDTDLNFPDDLPGTRIK